MRKSSLFLLVASLAIWGLASFGVSMADGGANNPCGTTHSHTRGGSCKNRTDGHIECGNGPGKIAGEPTAFLNLYANTSGSNPQFEACSDSGAGNQQGRVILEADQNEQGVRFILDSEKEQSFPAGYITVQASAKSGNRSGVYCSQSNGPNAVQDGYSKNWSYAHDEGGSLTEPHKWAECAPGN